VVAQKVARLARHQQEWIKLQEAFRLSQEALAKKNVELAELAKLAEEVQWLRREAHAQHRDEFERAVARLTPFTGRSHTDFTDFEKSVYLKSALNLCGGPEAIVSLVRAIEYVIQHRIPGAFAECGVFMGGNIEVMIRTLQHLRVDDRDIYLYDTFAGMPQPDPHDDDGLGGAMKISWEAHRTEADGTSGSNWMRASMETVRMRIDPLGYPAKRLHFVKGMVEDTIPGVAPDQIAILRLDTDFYRSTKHELEHLYPRLMPGGILIIDDYGAIPGARTAADEYASANQLGWFLHRVDPHVRLTVKPTTR
jgi:hypothetical protein